MKTLFAAALGAAVLAFGAGVAYADDPAPSPEPQPAIPGDPHPEIPCGTSIGGAPIPHIQIKQCPPGVAP
jgi:hypothetical protein